VAGIAAPGARSVAPHDAAGVASAFGDEVLRSAAVPGFEVSPAALFERPA
jgi:hypothetical protein